MAMAASAGGGGGNGTIQVNHQTVQSTGDVYQAQNSEFNVVMGYCESIDDLLVSWVGSAADAAREINGKMKETIAAIQTAVSQQATHYADANQAFADSDESCATGASSLGGN
jgi:ElaB/YqjD/DUF883 family membrane-anchored ribosome-binding protein